MSPYQPNTQEKPMKTITLEAETLENLLELAQYGLTKQKEELAEICSVAPEDVNERNDRVSFVAHMNRGWRALDRAEKKVLFS
tara:strand:+ start:429 stop:677 length:249 start_codon:yes stop_codon:yes gene_type:complete